jgi:hypothetical protein
MTFGNLPVESRHVNTCLVVLVESKSHLLALVLVMLCLAVTKSQLLANDMITFVDENVTSKIMYASFRDYYARLVILDKFNSFLEYFLTYRASIYIYGL